NVEFRVRKTKPASITTPALLFVILLLQTVAFTDPAVSFRLSVFDMRKSRRPKLKKFALREFGWELLSLRSFAQTRAESEPGGEFGPPIRARPPSSFLTERFPMTITSEGEDTSSATIQTP